MSAGLFNPGAGMAASATNMPTDPVGELLTRQKIAKLLAKSEASYADTSPKQHWLQAAAQIVDGAMQGLSTRDAIAAQLAQSQVQSDLARRMPAGTGSLGGTGSGVQDGPRLPAMAGGAQAMTMPAGDNGAIQGRFTDALKAGGLTNPYGLAAMTAYAQHESRYSPQNIGGTWADPSERGQAGTSGGILSWRNERLSAMQRATAGAKDPVAAQAKFALTEDPNLTLALQNAKSPEEANALMAQAWKFAGFNRPGGGEYANRLATTQAYASKFSGDQASASPQDASPADMPAPNAKPVEMTPVEGNGLPRTPEGFAIPPGSGQDGENPDDLRADIEAAYAAQQARQTDPRADMPAQNAQPVAMSPPDAGTDSGPVGVAQPAGTPPPSQARLDLAALFSGAPMGPAQSFAGTSGTIMDPNAADMPVPGAQPASMAPSPMQVPLPPARPSAADLQVAAASEASQAAPSPTRQRLYDTLAQPRTDAPDPQSAPGQSPREGIAALFGGVQDGLDRIFGGPQTQARLDAQGGAKQQIAQAITPPAPTQYASLPPAGQPASSAPAGPWGSGAGQGGILNRIMDGGAPAPAQAGGRMMGRDDFGRPTGVVDTGSAAGGGQPQPQVPQPSARMAQASPAPAGPQASSGNASGEAERVAWAREVLARSAQGLPMGEMTGVAADIIKRANQPRYGNPEDYEGGKLIRNPETNKPEWLLKPGEAGDKYQHVTLPNGGVFAFNPANPDTSKIILPGQPPRPLTPEERTAFGIPATQGAMMGPNGPQAVGGAGTTVNVDTKGASEFTKEANKIQAERYGAMVKAADNAVALRGDIETMADLAGQISSGKLAEAKLGLGQYAKAVGLDGVADKLTGGKMSEMEAFSALADKLTPQMRVPGSGNTSDAEGRAFKNSLPSLLKTPGGNAVIADTFRGMLDHQARAGEIAGQALRGEIGQAEADKMMRELPSPYARFKEYRSGAAAGEASGAGGAQRLTGSPPASGAIAPGQTTTINGLQIKRVN